MTYSWTHSQLSNLSDQRVTEEITKTQEAIKNSCGFTPTLLRFVLIIGVANLLADMTYEGARSVTGHQWRRQHFGCADGTHPGRRKGIQNHLLGKAPSWLSWVQRPICLDSSRIPEAIGIAGRAGNGRMVVSGPPQVFRKPTQKKNCAGVR
jgi:hypothetical protein